MITTALASLWQGAKKSYHHRRMVPTDVILFLTYRCTSRCKACNIWQRPVNKSEELTWKEWKPIFEKFRRSGVQSVELFGGDALLRKPLLNEMIRFCSKHGIHTYSTSLLVSDDPHSGQRFIRCARGAPVSSRRGERTS